MGQLELRGVELRTAESHMVNIGHGRPNVYAAGLNVDASYRARGPVAHCGNKE